MKKRLQWIFPLLSVIVLLGITQCRVVPTVATSVPLPSATEENTSTQTPTQTQTKIQTLKSLPTALVTLNPTEEKDNILNLLRTNDNCDLPCWWGVTPGQSTGTDIYSAFVPFSSISEGGAISPTRPGGINSSLLVNDYKIFLLMDYRFLENNNTIGIIGIKIKQTKRDKYSPYADVFNRYSLQNILSVYGPPEDVRVEADLHQFELNAPTFFYIYLSYPEKGIYVRYTTPAEVIAGNQVRSCPTEAYVDLWLTSPGKNADNMKLLTDMNVEWSWSRPSLQDASQMSIDQFYEKFTSQPNQCLTTPKSIWNP